MSLATLRQQIATVIAPPPVPGNGVSTGIAALDAALSGGGLPCGRLTEIVGRRGSGKTTLVRAIVAQALADKRWVAYIDAARTLAPTDWAALATSERLWIVRPPPPDAARSRHGAPSHGGAAHQRRPAPDEATRQASPREEGAPAAHGPWCADVLLRSGAFGLVVLDGGGGLPRGVAVRLTRLARESNAAFVVLREEGEGAEGDAGGGLVGGAVRLRVRRRPRAEGRARGRARERARERERERAREREKERERGREGGRDEGRARGREGWRWEALGARLARAAGDRPGDRPEGGTGDAAGATNEAPAASRPSLVMQVSVEKGGTHHVVEVGCAIAVARRLCAHPEVPDRRGVAARNRRGERVAPDAPGVRRTTPPADGVGGRGGATTRGTTAGASTGASGATLAHKRRCAEPAIGRDEFLLGSRRGMGRERRDGDHADRRLAAPLPPIPRDARHKPARRDGVAGKT